MRIFERFKRIEHLTTVRHRDLRVITPSGVRVSVLRANQTESAKHTQLLTWLI